MLLLWGEIINWIFNVIIYFPFVVTLRIQEIVERLHQHHQPEIDMKATSGAHGVDHMFRANDWNSFVEFDRGILQNTLEEWLSVGGMQRSAGNNLVAGQFHKDGRAAGLIMTGAKVGAARRDTCSVVV